MHRHLRLRMNEFEKISCTIDNAKALFKLKQVAIAMPKLNAKIRNKRDEVITFKFKLGNHNELIQKDGYNKLIKLNKR